MKRIFKYLALIVIFLSISAPSFAYGVMVSVGVWSFFLFVWAFLCLIGAALAKKKDTAGTLLVLNLFGLFYTFLLLARALYSDETTSSFFYIIGLFILNIIANVITMKSRNTKDEQGKTALMRAAEKGELQVVVNLLADGADINIKDDKGKTALDYAKENNHTEIAEFLTLAQNSKK